MTAKVGHNYQSNLPDSAWDFMLEFGIKAMAEERCSDAIYERINQIMEEANG
jgi:hypothetical protein